MIAQIKALSSAVPTIDKVMAPVGATASVLVGHLNDYLGIAVAGLTCLVLIPRFFIGWLDLRERLKVKVKVEVEGQPEE